MDSLVELRQFRWLVDDVTNRRGARGYIGNI